MAKQTRMQLRIYDPSYGGPGKEMPLEATVKQLEKLFKGGYYWQGGGFFVPAGDGPIVAVYLPAGSDCVFLHHEES